MDNVVRQLGMTVSDDTVSEEIHSIPEFAGITGTFDRATFQQKVSEIGYSEQGFIEVMRRDMARTS